MPQKSSQQPANSPIDESGSQRNTRRRKVVAVAIAVILLLLSAGAIFFYLQTQQANDSEEKEYQSEQERRNDLSQHSFGGEVVSETGTQLEVRNPNSGETREFHVVESTEFYESASGLESSAQDIEEGITVNVMYVQETQEAVEIWH